MAINNGLSFGKLPGNPETDVKEKRRKEKRMRGRAQKREVFQKEMKPRVIEQKRKTEKEMKDRRFKGQERR